MRKAGITKKTGLLVALTLRRIEKKGDRGIFRKQARARTQLKKAACNARLFSLHASFVEPYRLDIKQLKSKKT